LMKEKEWKEHGGDTKPNLTLLVLELTNFIWNRLGGSDSRRMFFQLRLPESESSLCSVCDAQVLQHSIFVPPISGSVEINNTVRMVKNWRDLWKLELTLNGEFALDETYYLVKYWADFMKLLWDMNI
jgi:hypothetical protein